MAYYLAKLCFEIVCGNGKHTPQFEEQIRLLETGSQQEAYLEAVKIGKEEGRLFLSGQQMTVQWTFLGITELISLPALVHGAELYQAHKEMEAACGYRNYVSDKFVQLQNKLGYAIDSI